MIVNPNKFEAIVVKNNRRMKDSLCPKYQQPAY